VNGQVEFKPEARDDGGPAFPTNDTQHAHAIAAAAEDALTGGTHDERERAYLRARGQAMRGMTLRDYFASQVDLTPYAPLELFRLIHGVDPTVEQLAECIAAIRLTEADAMLKARSA
jgi:hypothetical protein